MRCVSRSLKEGNETILDSINEGVFTVDLEWRITGFNRAAEEITQVPREEALGRRCSDVFRANICENACALRRTMSNRKPVLNATAHIVSRSGESIPIRISTALLRDNDGEVIGGVETFQDLSSIEQLQKAEGAYTVSYRRVRALANCSSSCLRSPPVPAPC